jgi:epoxyqueuosine reductase
MNLRERSELVKKAAREEGFESVGISKAGFLESEAPRLEEWLSRGYHGEMTYMEGWFEKRLDPTRLVEGAKSVISLSFNYATDIRQTDPQAPKISKYAFGRDYHVVVKEKLKNLLRVIQTQVGEVHGRAFVDSAPVLEKAWAARSGIGWVGKNTNLINQHHGSYFFLAELITDLELQADAPATDHCGTCTRCIDACPTEAIVGPYVVDGSRCISYFTIELRNEAIPEEFAGRFENWMFGCDICQEVCPWNRFSRTHNEPAFVPKPELLDKTGDEWKEITEEVFADLFRDSAVTRTGYAGLARNIGFLRRSEE